MLTTQLPAFLTALALLSSLAPELPSAPLDAAFTYQGRLTVGRNPASGSHDFRFVLYTAETRGSQIGSVLTNANVTVTSGLFSDALDFGAGVFNGTACWLEIAVRTNGGGSFTTLDPRQPLPPVPNSIYAWVMGTTISVQSGARDFGSAFFKRVMPS